MVHKAWLVAGMVFAVLRLCTYEDEEKRLQNVLDTWWCWLREAETGIDGWQRKAIRRTCLIAEAIVARIFGEGWRLVYATCWFTLFAVSSWLSAVSAMLLHYDPQEWARRPHGLPATFGAAAFGFLLVGCLPAAWGLARKRGVVLTTVGVVLSFSYVTLTLPRTDPSGQASSWRETVFFALAFGIGASLNVLVVPRFRALLARASAAPSRRPALFIGIVVAPFAIEALAIGVLYLRSRLLHGPIPFDFFTQVVVSAWISTTPITTLVTMVSVIFVLLPLFALLWSVVVRVFYAFGRKISVSQLLMTAATLSFAAYARSILPMLKKIFVPG
jgi:hypothetical protein